MPFRRLASEKTLRLVSHQHANELALWAIDDDELGPPVGAQEALAEGSMTIPS